MNSACGVGDRDIKTQTVLLECGTSDLDMLLLGVRGGDLRLSYSDLISLRPCENGPHPIGFCGEDLSAVPWSGMIL